MRTQNYTPNTEVICVSTDQITSFETKNWITEDNIQKGDRLKISQIENVAGTLAIKAEGKTHFHPHQKFVSLRSFVSLADMTFTKDDVGRKIEVKGKHYLSYTTGYGVNKTIKVDPRTTKTYTISKVNDRSVVVEYAGKPEQSVRLSFSVNENYNSNCSVRFK